MNDNAELMKLYSKRILALAAEISQYDVLEKPDATATKRSPLCGSTVTVALNVNEGIIVEYSQDVKACALGQASASVIGQNVIGQTVTEIQQGHNQLLAMLKTDGPPPVFPFDGLEALMPAKDYKNRHASIMLTFGAILEALDNLKNSK